MKIPKGPSSRSICSTAASTLALLETSTSSAAPPPIDSTVRSSVDAGWRLRLSGSSPSGSFARIEPRRPMDGIMTVGEVVESRAAGFGAGDSVWHALGWRDYAVVKAGSPALGGLGTLTRLDTQ